MSEEITFYSPTQTTAPTVEGPCETVTARKDALETKQLTAVEVKKLQRQLGINEYHKSSEEAKRARLREIVSGFSGFCGDEFMRAYNTASTKPARTEMAAALARNVNALLQHADTLRDDITSLKTELKLTRQEVQDANDEANGYVTQLDDQDAEHSKELTKVRAELAETKGFRETLADMLESAEAKVKNTNQAFYICTAFYAASLTVCGAALTTQWF